MRPLLRPFVMATVCVLGIASSRSAEAQPTKPPPGQKDKSNSQFMLRRGDAGGADAQTARARARAGDCAGALVAFDAAIAATIEPTLRRDRGLCHEKLGDPFPAIDDYRAYLTALPNAPDAEQIRQRLAALEEQVGVGGPSSHVVGSSDDNPELGSADAHASFAVDGEGAGETTKSSRKKKKRVDDGTQHSYDYYVAQEKRTDEAEASPLRYGSGFIIGPYLNIPRYFVGKGVPRAVSFNVGGTFRYSTGSLLTIVSEVGFAGLGTSNQIGGRSGVSLMGGLELRIPVSRYGSDNLLLRGGPGYEHLVESGTRATANFLTGRFGFGYRHVFGPSVGLELLVDGGPAVFFPEGGGEKKVYGLVGSSFALVVGF